MDAQKLCRPIGLLLTVLMLLNNTASAADKGRNLAARQANSAVSEQRIALVIGNGAYANAYLKNPVNDAKDMAKKLRGLGFIVIERNNLKKDQIGGMLREFRSKLAPGAVALVFYAGHGLQIKGINYLPAVDADINSEEDVPNQSIAVNQIMDVLDESKTRLNLVFLDACRNNPYARSFRSSERGLARVTAPSGTLISYATKPGSVAADGDGRNGLYTSKLLAQMDSNLQIEQALKRVVTAVKAASQGRQEPWMEGSIEGDFCFAGCAANGGTQVASLAPAPVAQNIPVTDDAEGILWQAAESSGIEEDVRTYLRQYPNGRYVALANARIQTFADDAVQAMLQKEQDVWQAAGKANTEAGYQEYLKAYPAGRFVALVSGRLDKLKADRAQEETKFLAKISGMMAMIRIPGKNYELGKFEVTQAEWKAVMGSNPSKFSNCGDTCPVENVSWNDVQEFISKLNTKTGRQYRLPTEAEWKYACYGGNQTEYCGGNNLDAVGWYDDNSGSKTHPVGQKQANGYGLYDMSGNVWEWMQDELKGARALRGGSWGNLAVNTRAAGRSGIGPGYRINNIGFRVARTLP